MIYVSVFYFLVLLKYKFLGLISPRGQLYLPLLIFMFLFSAFRFEVGCDWTGYLNHFAIQRAATMTDALSERAPLWWAMIEVQHRLGLPYPWMNVFSSAIFFLGVHILARRQPDPLAFLVLAFPILVVNMPMSAMRQGVAVGIMCMAFAAFADRSLWRFIALTVTASAFHSSASVFLLLAPLVRGGYTWMRLVMAGVLAVPGAVLLLSTDETTWAVTLYVDTGRDAAGAAFRVGILIATAAFFFLTLRRKWASTYPADYKLVSLGATIMAAMMVLVPFSTVIGDRLAYYMIPLQTMIFARIPFLPIKENRAVYILAPYLMLMFVFLFWTLLSWHFNQCYLPYRTWLFGFPENARYAF